MLRRFLPRTAVATIATAVALLAGPASAEQIIGLTSTNSLVSFDSASPSIVGAPIAITGIQSGEDILGIDFRPATGQLYGLGSTSRLYVIDTATGSASQVGGTFAIPLSGFDYGFDFNPTVDRIRVVATNGQNLRLNPVTGAVVDGDTVTPGLQPDGNLNYGAATGLSGTPGVAGAAYTNNDTDPTTGTTLYVIDAGLDRLFIQSPPNAGGLVNPAGGTIAAPLGIDVTTTFGFDISGLTGTAFLATFGGTAPSQLFTVNLATGAATSAGFIGPIADSSRIRGIAARAVPEPSSFALLGLGAVGLIGYARSRRASKAATA